MVESIVAAGVAERREQERDIDERNLANQISSGVNRAIVPAMQDTLKGIARAMRS